MGRRIEHDGKSVFEVRFPFDRRLVERIKSLPHRRWNASGRFWTVPDTDAVMLVDLLRPERFRFDEATREIYASMGGTASLDDSALVEGPAALPLFEMAGATPAVGDAPRANSATDLTVSELNTRVRDVIQSAFPDRLWLVGEISGFNKSAHRKHVGFQFVEIDDDGRKVSEVAATLFQSARQEIERALAQAGDPFRLEDEVTVRMGVRVELYVPWGSYRVIVEELDIRYTLGEAARRREEIIRKLSEEGLTDRNPALPLPALPLNVGLITSLGSDAYNDVLHTLRESGFAFRLTAHGARVQGHQTVPSVLNALDFFEEPANRPEVLLICRGGGSRTDLAWFDSDILGRAVALCSVPVIVGIGHEQDTSVLDAVARRAKTPTAAAGMLVDAVGRGLERLERSGREILERAAARTRDERQLHLERSRRLAAASRHLLDRERSGLDHRSRRTALGARGVLILARQRLTRWTSSIPRDAAVQLERRNAAAEATARAIVRFARHGVSAAGDSVGRLAAEIGPRAARSIRLASDRQDARARRLELLDPRRVIERGYAILRLDGDGVVTRAEQAPAGARLEAELRDGRLRLTSDGSSGHEESG